MLLVGFTAVATDADKSDAQNKQDNAAVYYRKAYGLWRAGKRAEAVAQVRKGSTKSRYEPEPGDIMGFTRKEEKSLEDGTVSGEMKLAEKLQRSSPDLVTAEAIVLRILEEKTGKTEANYWVVVRFGKHIGGEKWALDTQLVGIVFEMNGYQHLKKLYIKQGRTNDLKGIRKRISVLQARVKKKEKEIGESKPPRF